MPTLSHPVFGRSEQFFIQYALTGCPISVFAADESTNPRIARQGFRHPKGQVQEFSHAPLML
jgi:hypothetical protein